MEKGIKDILERPFDAKLISQKQGYDYIAGCNIIQRLNEAFNGDWSYECEMEFRDDKFIVVKGKLTAGGITKEQFGCDDIGYYSEGHKRAGEVMDIGFDYKAAATDALKKCATLFGVALHLYGDLEKPEPPQEDAITSTAAKGCFACAATLRIPDDIFDSTLYETFKVESKKEISLPQWERMHLGLQSIVQTVTMAAWEFAGVSLGQKEERDKAVEELVIYLNETKGEWKEKSAALRDEGNTGSRREIFASFKQWKQEQEVKDEAEEDMPE